MYSCEWWNIHDGRLSRAVITAPVKDDDYAAHGRGLIGDWGRIGNISVDENLNIWTPFNTEWPLAYKGNLFYYHLNSNFAVNCAEANPHLFFRNRKQMLSSYRHIQHKGERISRALKRRHKEQMETFNNLVHKKSYKKLTKHSSFIPSFLKYLVNEKSELLQLESVALATKLSSFMYSGGCIKTVILQNDFYIVFCDGKNLSELTVKRFNVVNNVLEDTSICEYRIDEEDASIFEIDVTYVDNYAYILVRTTCSITVLMLFVSDNGISMKNLSKINSMEEFISCKLFRKSNNQIITTTSDQIKLYDVESRADIWIKDIICFSSVMDKWNEIRTTESFQILVTNRANTYMYDTRVNPYKTGLELFTVSQKSFSKGECLYHATDVFEDYYLYLFSTNKGCLVDMRAPKMAVSQWTMPTMSPASYSSMDIIAGDNKFNFTVGCQSEAKHFVFQQYAGNHSKCSFLVSNTDTARDSVMSLGLVSHFNDLEGILSIFTLDDRASILGQQYTYKSGTRDDPMVSFPTSIPYQPTKRYIQSSDSFILPTFQINDQYEPKVSNKESDFDRIYKMLRIHRTDPNEDAKFE